MKKKKYISLFLIITLVGAIVINALVPNIASANENAQEELSLGFKDKNLYDNLLIEVNKLSLEQNKYEQLTTENLLLLENIDLSNKGISNLAGIENLKNLKSINLSSNSIVDLSPLSALNQLESLNISEQKIEKNIPLITKSEITIENPLKDIHGQTISDLTPQSQLTESGDIYLCDLKNGQQNYQAMFKHDTGKGEFSGEIVWSFSVQLEDTSRTENTDPATSETESGGVSLDENDDSLGLSSEVNFGSSDILGEPNFDNWFKYAWHEYAGHKTKYTIDGGTVEAGSYMRQKFVMTSPAVDLNRDLEIEGTLQLIRTRFTGQDLNDDWCQWHHGFSILFHDDPTGKDRYNGARPFANLAVYDVPRLGAYNGNPLDNGVVLEVDSSPSSNNSNRVIYGDANAKGPHISINETDANARVSSTSKLVPISYNEPAEDYAFPTPENFKISWDSSENLMTFTLGEWITEKKISSEMAQRLKNNAYISLVACTGDFAHDKSQDGQQDGQYLKAPIRYHIKKINYTSQPEINVSYLKKDGSGNETVVPNNSIFEEEEEVKIRYQIKNTQETEEEKSVNLQLTDQSFRNERVLEDNSTSPFWYKPYIVKGSFKSYVGESETDDQTIDATKFLEGEKIQTTLPANQQVRTIEYVIRIPKVLGKDITALSHELTVGSEVNKAQMNTKGEEVVSIPDSALKQGLVTNVVNTIPQERPTVFEQEVYAKELATLNEIELSGLGISNLTGIEYCENARNIDLSTNKISEVSQLAGLSQLDQLNLSENEAPQKVEQLTQLTILYLNSANLDSDYLEKIGQLSNLEEFYAQKNKIKSVAPLKSCDSLRVLNLDNNLITDLRPLSNIQSYKDNIFEYSVLNQVASKEEPYFGEDTFSVENTIYLPDGISKDIVESEKYLYDAVSNKVVWTGVTAETKMVSYQWESEPEPRQKFSGTMSVTLRPIDTPDYLVEIPSQLTLGDVIDENSPDYDPTIDPTSPDYNPDITVDKQNPLVSGMVGGKDIVSVKSNEEFSGKITIYTDAVCTMTNDKDPKDRARVNVYKSFEDKLTGLGTDKADPLMELTNENRKGVFRLKTPSESFVVEKATYTGTMQFIIEYNP
ncbi:MULTISPECIES: leucine-rich repeat domain-containing protein [unclassified Enterococcus]|uniref:leucine-rich repeat domain-containing protein n=1 Tax=unclassified Enterococcus TaxID=2608891 RepID=UPI003F1E6A69